MGVRGPVPKRSEQRRRANAPAFPLERVAGGLESGPELGLELHPLAEDWYRALAGGAEARFYTAAMWERARVTAVMLSRVLESARPSAQMYAALQADMKALLVDAGELRRLGIEVQAAEEAPKPRVDYRARLAAAGS